MNCRDAEPLLHARLDNELDVAGVVEMDRHLTECRACAAQYAALEHLRQEIADAQPAYPLPAGLEQKLSARFARPGRAAWLQAWRWQSAAVAGAIACILIGAIVLPRVYRPDQSMATEILDSHLRGLQPGHLIDVESSDQHTVKPWFQGRTDFSPPVPDLANDGFTLVGGRLEVIHQQPTAAIVYRRRQHVISLYVTPSPGGEISPVLQDQDGYHLLHWARGNMSYWAVSDVAAADLQDFANLIEGASANGISR